jgi:hypothetical protein
VTRELLAVGATLGSPSRRIRGERLSESDYERYQVLSGRYIREDLEAAITDPEWQNLPPEDRKEWVTDIKRVARADARADLGLDADDEDEASPLPSRPPDDAAMPSISEVELPAGFELIEPSP